MVIGPTPLTEQYISTNPVMYIGNSRIRPTMLNRYMKINLLLENGE